MISHAYKMLHGMFEKDTCPRLFFCINSGRSGSKYLAEILGTAEEVISYHEPEPTMTGKYLQMVNKFPYYETFNERRIKSEAIKKTLRSFSTGKAYCEVSHMFIKTFFDIMVQEFQNVEVILLRRELTLVLKSFIELGYFSPKNDAWPDWMTSPNAKTAALACIGPDEKLDQYDLCIAYLFDIEARVVRFQEQYPLIKTHEVRLESLNNYSNVEALFKELRITPTDKTRLLLGKIVNARVESKNNYNNPTDLQYCRRRIKEYIEKSYEMGISLPDTLALES